ncbi:MAG TPA: Mth938-like domain-containing protein [Dongiaceae bacterium]|jgi:uncharacterized protein
MDVTPLIPGGRQIIESYGEGRFRIAGQVHPGAVIVFLERTIAWPVTAPEQAGMDNLAPVIAAAREGSVDLLLFGQGKRMLLVPPALRQGLREAGIVVEPMDTGAACRTYNVLMAEGRRVAAALIPVA